MVDPQGKPFEIGVIRSTGNKTFDKIAVESIERSYFEPASLNGGPIESGYELKYVFVSNTIGVRHEFQVAYKSLLAAVQSGDRTAADAAMARLKVTNLTEDAYLGVATYLYANKWGDESQQLDALTRAIAEANEPYYLPADLYWSVLRTRMALEVKSHLYAEALVSWKRLQKSHMDPAMATSLKNIVQQLEAARSDNSAYEVSGLISDTGWHLHLFKRHFRAEVSEGYISQVKLRCAKNHRFFAFDPKLQYEIGSKDGDCAIELDGAPGTRFKLTQF